MLFRSPTDTPIHIALTNGRTALVGPTPAVLGKEFQAQAIALGALPDGVDAPVPEADTGFNRKQAIADAMNAMLDGQAEGDFTPAGKPSLKALIARLGFQVERSEADRAWNEISKEAP